MIVQLATIHVHGLLEPHELGRFTAPVPPSSPPRYSFVLNTYPREHFTRSHGVKLTRARKTPLVVHFDPVAAPEIPYSELAQLHHLA